MSDCWTIEYVTLVNLSFSPITLLDVIKHTRRHSLEKCNADICESCQSILYS